MIILKMELRLSDKLKATLGRQIEQNNNSRKTIDYRYMLIFDEDWKRKYMCEKHRAHKLELCE